MSMNIDDLKVVVRYVEQHPGCSEADIQAGCPKVKNLGALLSEASQGIPLGKGFVLEQRNGLYYPGPAAYHLN